MAAAATYAILKLKSSVLGESVAEKKKTSDKEKEAELKTFIGNVNKKDKVSGLKIHFAFVNRKRRG